MDNQVVENILAFEVLPVETDDGTSIISNSAARRPMASLHSLWTKYYPQGVIGEDIVIPGSTLKFVIAGLLSFVEIKSQGKTGFPFQTHPQVVMVAINSLLMYGLATTAENVLSAAVLTDRTSAYFITARLGRMASLYMLVGSLATLFYF